MVGGSVGAGGGRERQRKRGKEGGGDTFSSAQQSFVGPRCDALAFLPDATAAGLHYGAINRARFYQGAEALKKARGAFCPALGCAGATASCHYAPLALLDVGKSQPTGRGGARWGGANGSHSVYSETVMRSPCPSEAIAGEKTNNKTKKQNTSCLGKQGGGCVERKFARGVNINRVTDVLGHGVRGHTAPLSDGSIGDAADLDACRSSAVCGPVLPVRSH